MISQRMGIIIIGIVVMAIALAVGFGYGFLRDTLGLTWHSIRWFAMLLLLVIVVPILWSATLRDWARRPGGSDGRKNGKQRS